MDKSQKFSLKKKNVNITFFNFGDNDDFLPWGDSREIRHRNYIHLKKGNERGFFFLKDKGADSDFIRKMLFKLTGEGWEKFGELNIEFDGRSKEEREIDEFFNKNTIVVELGRKLLPLVDPGAGAALLEAVKTIRKEIAQDTGYVIPGIRVKDNLHIPFDNYVIYIKETPVASGEIFLDRFLALGDRDKLSQLKGWNTKEPVYNQQGVWIEPSEKDRAEELECVLMGGLNVIITHLNEAIKGNLRDLLGLQDIYEVISRLKSTHPIVVEDFLNDKKKLRLIRKILRNLVSERVSIRDMVTILETLGDYEDKLENIDFVTEIVRISLARQICWSYIEPDGIIKGLTLSRKMEQKIQQGLKKSEKGVQLVISRSEIDIILKSLKKTLEDYKNPMVIFCDPPTRLYFRRLTEVMFPGLGILSTAEIAPRIPIEILGEVELPEDISLEKIIIEEGGEKDKKQGGLFSFIKS